MKSCILYALIDDVVNDYSYIAKKHMNKYS